LVCFPSTGVCVYDYIIIPVVLLPIFGDFLLPVGRKELQTNFILFFPCVISLPFSWGSFRQYEKNGEGNYKLNSCGATISSIVVAHNLWGNYKFNSCGATISSIVVERP
jgi:hypothetical protein